MVVVYPCPEKTGEVVGRFVLREEAENVLLNFILRIEAGHAQTMLQPDLIGYVRVKLLDRVRSDGGQHPLADVARSIRNERMVLLIQGRSSSPFVRPQ